MMIAIVNPHAGGGRARQRIVPALAALKSQGVRVEARFSEHPGHAVELTRQAVAEGHRSFIAAGGDGTVFEVVNALFASGALPPERRDQVRLGVLPLGTGNSFLRDLGSPDDAAAVAAISSGELRPCDVLRIEHRDGVTYSLNLISIGFSAAVGSLTNRRFKHFGAAGYVLAVVCRLFSLRATAQPIVVALSPSAPADATDARPSTLLSFCNSRFTGGGMMMAPQAQIDDGLLDLIRVDDIGRARLLATFPRIFRGTHVGQAGIEQRRAWAVDFVEERPQDVMIDGEVMRLTMRRIEVLPGALCLLALGGNE